MAFHQFHTCVMALVGVFSPVISRYISKFVSFISFRQISRYTLESRKKEDYAWTACIAFQLVLVYSPLFSVWVSFHFIFLFNCLMILRLSWFSNNMLVIILESFYYYYFFHLWSIVNFANLFHCLSQTQIKEECYNFKGIWLSKILLFVIVWILV